MQSPGTGLQFPKENTGRQKWGNKLYYYDFCFAQGLHPPFQDHAFS